MFGRLEIPAGVRRHLCLHRGAVQRIGQLEFVRVVDPETKRLERRFVKTGQRGYGPFMEVLSGLKAGETVVVRDPGVANRLPGTDREPDAATLPDAETPAHHE